MYFPHSSSGSRGSRNKSIVLFSSTGSVRVDRLRYIWNFICLLLFAGILNSGCATNPQEYRVNSIIYWQSAAEVRALYYQAFNIARLRLDAILSNREAYSKPLAIVVDIDETLLDNSPYQVKQLRNGVGFTKASWKEWSDSHAAQATPGSVDFLQYAEHRGIHVLYLTNREENDNADETKATLRNLIDLGFPWVDNKHYFPRKDISDGSKESRRKEIAETYDIVLLIGDNLSDFSSLFEVTGIDIRKSTADNARTLFGERFIILPNSMYGDWESFGVYKGRRNLSESEKTKLRKNVLQGE